MLSGLLNEIPRKTDSYKVSHYKQYPPGCSNIRSYFESRGGDFGETTFFSLQYYLKKYLTGRILHSDIARHAAFMKAHFGMPMFNTRGWTDLIEKYPGALPVSIRAVPEGTTVPSSNVLLTVESTDPNFIWIVNYLETLLVKVWYGTSTCTISRQIKKVILRYLAETGDENLIGFKLHDFGYRGVSSEESAGIGGAGHLVNFLGTDTTEALAMVLDYYSPAAPEVGSFNSIHGYENEMERYYAKYMPGFSIPASEHSTITSWGRENELFAFKNMLDQYPTGLVACVSDSYDIFKACSDLWGKELRERILNRNGTLVVRPDSGDPVKVVLTVLRILGEKFGYSNNNKGYKVLDPHVRVIQGDGIDYAMVGSILDEMKSEGWSADNIAFGSGGALLQKMNRDTHKMAFKCSQVVVNGVAKDVYKDPVTDHGKRSKRGVLRLVTDEEGNFYTSENVDSDASRDHLVEVYNNGVFKNETDFASIRERAKIV